MMYQPSFKLTNKYETYSKGETSISVHFFDGIEEFVWTEVKKTSLLLYVISSNPVV